MEIPHVRRKHTPHTNGTKEKAQYYYILGLSLLEIEKLIDVPLRTLEKWQSVYEWRKVKNPKIPHNKKRKAYDLHVKGFSKKEIAEKMQVDVSTVHKWIKHVIAESE